ncbi:hypothetical protein [Chitinophaga tropicalis]|uniref:Peptidase S74 domain-containing protein n=1 Tax=Chitinophaga tropicalis TaxID=2683588 RepID=A0A7K1U2Q6_9BACT|nr:hypothetical protein [Chitinophaga tropicalis]MVT08652.1 hypothetical protein [Chitinophaga tropicalis]
MKAIFILLPVMGTLTVCAQNKIDTTSSALGIGTKTPSFYYHGGNNMGLEIFNSNTSANSQAHLILSTGATGNFGSTGTLSWMTPNSTGNKGVAYIAARTMQDATTNATGDLFFATADNAIPTVKMRITSKGYVGIGVNDPRAYFDVAFAANNVRASVLARLPEGNDVDAGTYIGVEAYSTTGGQVKSFALEHKFYGKLNSAINFYRGGDMTGGFMTFSTNTGVERMRIDANGNVGIGTTATQQYKLAVEGTIGARRLRIDQGTWADFVFDPGYKLPSLMEVEQYIKVNRHLPDVPSTNEVKENGIDVGEMNKVLLQKVEELTLLLIQEHKEKEEIKKELEGMKFQIKELQKERK